MAGAGRDDPPLFFLSLKLFEFGNFLRPEAFVGRFENEGNAVETRVAHDVLETTPAQLAGAQRGVAVTALGFQRVVEVHSAQVSKAHDAFQLRKNRFRIAHIVACGEGVAGVDAHPHPALVLDLGDDLRQMFEPETDVAPLPRCVFDDGGDSVRPVERTVDAFGYSSQTFVHQNLPKGAPRVEVQTVDAQLLATVHFVVERLARLLQLGRRGVTEIYQIAVVGQNLPCAVTEGGTVVAKFRDGVGRKWRRVPLSLVFGEQRKGRCADFVCPERCVFHPACRADVCSDILFHTVKVTIFSYLCAYMKHLFSILILMLATAASAQFTIPSTAPDKTPTVPIPVRKGEVDVKVLNEAEARVRKKELWNSRNAVDFRVSATGFITHFNKSWKTNNENAIAGEFSSYYYHTFQKGRHTTIFKFDALYGMNYIDEVWFKNQDLLKLYFLSSWKLKEQGALRNWAYSFSAGFATQFSQGFKSRTEKILWSNFMAPGTLNLGVGLTYTSPNKKFPFIVTVNPVSGNALFVLDDRIDDARRKELGITTPRKADGSIVRHKLEGGSNLNVAFNRTFALSDRRDWMTLQYNTTFSSFYGWMTQLSRDNVAGTRTAIIPTVNWTNSLIFNPLKFLSLEFRTTMFYDRAQIDKLQMQYYLRVGLTYRFKNR